MKNLKLTKIYFTVFVIIFAVSMLMGCSEDNILNTSQNSEYRQTDAPDSNVIVTPRWEGNVLVFQIQNNLPAFINDFHVQFDSTVKIIGWVIPIGWTMDPNSTDTAKGKIGDKVQGGQPIQPGQTMNGVIAVQLKFTGASKKKPSQWWDFTWQATRNGVVVYQGRDAFPRR